MAKGIGSLPWTSRQHFAKDLIRYLFATSADRARIFGELLELNPGMAELLMDLEADADLRARCEMDLLAES